MILGRRKHFLLPVDCSARRGEGDLFNAVTDAVLEKPDRPEDVDVGVKVRFADRAPDVHLGRLVRERIGFEVLEGLCTTRSYIHLVEPSP